MAKGEKQKKRVPLPLGEKCTPEMLTVVDAFLRRNNLAKVSKALNRDMKKRHVQLLAKKDTPELEQIIQEWQAAKEEDDDESSSDDSDDSSEDSDDSSSEGSDSDSSAEVETPAPKSLKRKAPSPSSSESDSDDSDSDSDSEPETKPVLKKVKTGISTAAAAVKSATTAIAKSVAPAVEDASESDETSSDSDSSESEDERPGLGSIPKISTTGQTDGAADSSDSSSEDSSESDSDSSESDSEVKPVSKKKTASSKSKGLGKLKDQTPPSSVSTLSAEPNASSSTAGQLKSDSTPKELHKSTKSQNAPFSRIPKDQYVPPPSLSSNAYQFGGNNAYADRAHQDLIVTKGKSFTKEKNKKKRGSYRGGIIDTGPSKAIKFED